MRVIFAVSLLCWSAPIVAQETFQAERVDVYEAEVSLPAELADYPGLNSALQRDAQSALLDFAEMAGRAYQDHLDAEMDWPWNPYFLSNNWSVTYADGSLVSLVRHSSHYTGGAHPNLDIGTIVTRPDGLEPLGLEDFINDVSPESQGLTALFYAVYRELMAMKRERLGEGFDEAMERDTWLAPLAAELEAFPPFALIPNRSGDAAGGLMFYFSPYAVGSYAEGSYEVPVPYSAFADYLLPVWQDIFSGEPAMDILTRPGDQLEPLSPIESEEN